jgi:hypothetical protein
MTRNRTDDLQQFLDDLTPLEREAIATATAQDWMDALGACVKDPTFWQGIGTAFVEGLANGFRDYLEGDR